MAQIQAPNMGAILSSMNAGGEQNKKAFHAFNLLFGAGAESALFRMEQDVLTGFKALGAMGAAEMILGLTHARNSPMAAIFSGVFNKDSLFEYTLGGASGGSGAGESGGSEGGGGSDHAFPSLSSAAQGFAQGASYEGEVPMASLGRQSPQATPGIGAGQGMGMDM